AECRVEPQLHVHEVVRRVVPRVVRIEGDANDPSTNSARSLARALSAASVDDVVPPWLNVELGSESRTREQDSGERRHATSNQVHTHGFVGSSPVLVAPSSPIIQAVGFLRAGSSSGFFSPKPM